ncbi:MAG: (2Fe-2S) ferredoxin domain-containing protein [Gammaproteobacteria bacterium]|nr:(2Fe-2S) ferredoxin domain-containing protein [Gammaproteobacteria bacterium]
MNPARLIVCVNQRLGFGQKSCAGSGSRELIDIIKNHFKNTGIDVPVVEQVCLGRCAEGIAMRIAPGGQFFTRVTEADVGMIGEAVRQFSLNV